MVAVIITLPTQTAAQITHPRQARFQATMRQITGVEVMVARDVPIRVIGQGQEEEVEAKAGPNVPIAPLINSS